MFHDVVLGRQASSEKGERILRAVLHYACNKNLKCFWNSACGWGDFGVGLSWGGSEFGMVAYWE